MSNGKARGRRLEWGIGLFAREEGGFTSVGVAVALLACLALVFSLAQVQRAASRAAHVQTVVDAAALSAVEPVRAFRTVAQVADATVLSLGLTGLFVVGAGAVTSLVPGAASAGLRVVEAGRSILESRRQFAESAAKGLQRVEKWLPAAIAAEGWAVVRANATDGLDYQGVALAFPAEGASSYGLADDVATDELEEKAEAMGEASDQLTEEAQEAQAALEEGWRADCVDGPSCARSRAASLAGLSGAQNPNSPSIEGWGFGMALSRARAYYAARAVSEAPAGDSVAERARSALRKAYYEHALAQVRAGYVRESQERVDLWLPELPHNAETTRASELFSQTQWPCSQEEAGRTVHAFAGCPGAQGPADGTATLADLEAGNCRRCDTCGLDTAAMGSVGSASTNISNGYEYYWTRIVGASQRWQEAENRRREAEEEERRLAEEGADLFQQALDALAVPRPKLQPPGYLGVIAVAVRPGTDAAPGLQSAFAASGSLPSGAAIAGACLAAQDATGQENLLVHFFDFMAQGEEGGVAGVLEGITALWGELLCGYGSAYGAVAQAAEGLFDGMDAVGLGGVARWLGDKLGSLVAAAGFEPADLRLRKPVLCSTQDILSADGSATAADVRRYVQALPAEGGPGELLRAFGRQVADDLGDQEVTIAELTVPGTSVRVPFKIRVKSLWGSS